jgi:SEC-C motif-containing protein
MAIPTENEAQLREFCLPFIRGEKLPATAAELMASRYVAYSLAEVDYILATHDPATQSETDREATEDWAKKAKFTGLKILSTERGEAGDDTGEVEFQAFFTAEGTEHMHHERSTFVRKDGKWFFAEGTQVQIPKRREEPKVGRNDPCFCGSGKKHKKCHGARSA